MVAHQTLRIKRSCEWLIYHKCVLNMHGIKYLASCMSEISLDYL